MNRKEVCDDFARKRSGKRIPLFSWSLVVFFMLPSIVNENIQIRFKMNAAFVVLIVNWNKKADSKSKDEKF